MGYALFAQRKVLLDSLLNTYQLMQTQRTNEQNALATQSQSLQRQLSSLQEAQAYELGDMYDLLSHSEKEGGFEADWYRKIMDTKGRPHDPNEEIEKCYDEFVPEAQDLLDRGTNIDREKINAEIEEMKNKQQNELGKINNKIYEVGVKENAIELEVKRLDTLVDSTQKQLEAVEQAEGKAIERAVPKFQGLG